MEVSVAKHFVWEGLKILGLMVFVLLAVKQCGGCEHNAVKVAKYDNKPLLDKMKSDSILIIGLKKKILSDSVSKVASKHKEDSLVKIKDKYTYLYQKSSKNVREQISNGICDTNSVKIALDNSDSLHVVKDKLLAQKDSTNNYLTNENLGLRERLVLTEGMVTSAKVIIHNQNEDYLNYLKLS